MPSSPFSRLIPRFIVAAAAAIPFFQIPRSFANQINWNASTGDWSNPSNWSSYTVPGPSDTVLIYNGDIATISSGNVTTAGEGLGENSNGTINQTGGTNTTSSLTLGWENGSGTYNLSGGSLVVNGIYYGSNGEYLGAGFGTIGTGTFNQTGGTNTTDILAIGAQYQNTGTYVLSGGSLYANELLLGGESGPEGTGTFSISGTGQLNVPGYIFVQTGSQFTVNGGSMYAAALDDAAAYAQTGGNAVFAAMDTGPANLSGGTLTLVANQQQFPQSRFDALSSFEAANISGTATLQVGDLLSVQTLDMTGGTIAFGTSSGEISVDYDATLSAGSISFFVTGVPSSSCYPVLTAQSLNCSLTFTPYTVGRLTFTPSVQGNSIIVNVTGAPACLTWNNTAGGDGQTWDTQQNANWTSTATPGNPNQFYTLDNTIFDDDNNGHYNVNIAPAGVQPNSVTINTTGIYTFTGGAITSGSGGLNVNAGTLVLQNSSNFYGVVVDGGTLAISASGSLTVAGNEYVGNNSNGTFNQSSGTHLIQGTLTLGTNKGSSGTYYLTGGVLTMAPSGSIAQSDTQYIGNNGSGFFIQSGGINNAGDLELSGNAGSFGSYSLSGSSQLIANLTLGGQGQDVFNQFGGTISGHTVYITPSTGAGTYNLAENGLMTFDYEILGGTGLAAFYQNAGTNNVKFLFIGSGPASSPTQFTPVNIFYLSGGSISAIQEEISGAGTTEFIQTGGSNTIYSSIDGAEFDMGQSDGTTGLYSLSGGSFYIDASTYIGGYDNGPDASAIFNVSDRGVLTITGTLQIYPAGQVNINGGTAAVGSLSISPGGFLNLNDALTIDYGKGNLDPISTIRSYLQTGYDNGKWDGPGINSSLAASTPGTTIGYADTGSQIILQYTWLGDANLDGIVDASDLADISPSGTTWATGDFNYDGKVNADDYALFMLGQSESNGENISMTLPEPSLLFASGFGLVASFPRRRK